MRKPHDEVASLPIEIEAGERKAPSRWNLDAIVAELRLSREVTHNIRHQGMIRRPPSREALAGILDDLWSAIFPTHLSDRTLHPDAIDYFVGSTIDAALGRLCEQVERSLAFTHPFGTPDKRGQRAVAITREFGGALAEVRGLLVSDLRAAYQGDPAATGTSEILLGYPGMRAIVAHRLAHELYRRDATLAARLIADVAHARTGIDIHPGARIGPGFFIDHGTGVVIGQTAVIGSQVRLYQGVTLGARHFPADETGTLIKAIDRHPIVEDDVVIYAGATILGRVTIGRGSVIGGNVWLTRSVAPGTRVTQSPSEGRRDSEERPSNTRSMETEG